MERLGPLLAFHAIGLCPPRSPYSQENLLKRQMKAFNKYALCRNEMAQALASILCLFMCEHLTSI